MTKENDFVIVVQELLDEGLTMNKAAKVLGVHHSKINRLLSKGEVEIYTPFDESEQINAAPNDLDWVDAEDILEDACNVAYDNHFINVNDYLGEEKFIKVGIYVRNTYGNLRRYLIAKNKVVLRDFIHFKCKNCGEVKPVKDYCRKMNNAYGLGIYECTSCIQRRVKEFREQNEWYVENCRESVRRYAKTEAGRLSLKISIHNRRAMELSLPNDFTTASAEQVISVFNGCALSGECKDTHLDHVIPLAIGHGGTTYGNMIPLRSDLNISKHKNNIFEWFEANRQRFELSQERFDNLIAWLASANAMSVEEYRDYVYWCHANPRSIDELKDELRKDAI